MLYLLRNSIEIMSVLSSFIPLYLLIPKGLPIRSECEYVSRSNSWDLSKGLPIRSKCKYVSRLNSWDLSCHTYTVVISIKLWRLLFLIALFTMIFVETIFKYLLKFFSNVIFCWFLYQNSSKSLTTLKIREYKQ